MNMPERTLDDVRRFVGNGVARLIELAVPEGTAPEVFEQTLAIFREYYDIHCNDNTKAYDGVIDLLRELKADGYALAIVSNKPDSAVKELAEIYFEGIVKVAIGESAGVAKKPAPDTVYAALKELGMPKEGAVYVGDSEVDVMTAKNSGLPCISVLWGFREEAFLKRTWCRSFCPRTGGDQRFPECVGLLRNVSLLVRKYHCMIFVHKVQ